MDGEELGLLDNSGSEDAAESGEESFIETGDEVGGDEGGDQGGDRGGEGGTGDEGGDEGGDAGSRGAIVKFTPDVVKKALREIATSNPEFAKKFPTLEKTITRALYKDSQLTQRYGGLQAVNEAFEVIETHGGLEGIENLANEVALARQLEDGFKKGDPLVVDGWAKDYPSGFLKLLPVAFDKAKTLNKERWEQLGSYITREIFTEYGVYSVVAALGEALQDAKPENALPAAIKQFNLLAKFLNDSRGLADKAKAAGSGAADSELDEERESIAEEKKKIFYGSVRQEVNAQVMSRMNRLIKLRLPQGKKIKVDQANSLRKEINAELARVVNSTSGYAEKYDSVMNARNKERAVRFILAKAFEKLPRVVGKVMSDRNLLTGGNSGGGGGARRQARGGGGGSSEHVGKPNRDDIDWVKTDKAVWLTSVSAGRSTGPIYLKNGKIAKW